VTNDDSLALTRPSPMPIAAAGGARHPRLGEGRVRIRISQRPMSLSAHERAVPMAALIMRAVARPYQTGSDEAA